MVWPHSLSGEKDPWRRAVLEEAGVREAEREGDEGLPTLLRQPGARELTTVQSCTWRPEHTEPQEASLSEGHRPWEFQVLPERERNCTNLKATVTFD